MQSPKIQITETMINEFTTDMQLTISSLEKKDFGEYFCRAESTVGRAEGIIRLSGTIFRIAFFTSSVFPFKNTPLRIASENERDEDES